jgi:hypothetical protein
MASYYEAIREFRELTKQRERAVLDERGERRLLMLAAWIDAGATTDPPEVISDRPEVISDRPEVVPDLSDAVADPPESRPLPTNTDRFAAGEDPSVPEADPSEEPVVREPTLRMLRDPVPAPAVDEEEAVHVEVSAGPRSNEWLASPADSHPHPVSGARFNLPADAVGAEGASAPDFSGVPGAGAASHPDWFADVQWDERPPAQPLVISAEPQWEAPSESSAELLREAGAAPPESESSWDSPGAVAAEPAEEGEWDLPLQENAPLLVAAPDEDLPPDAGGVPLPQAPSELTSDLPLAEVTLLPVPDQVPAAPAPGPRTPSLPGWSQIPLIPLSESEDVQVPESPAGTTPPPATAWSLPTVPIYRPGAAQAPVAMLVPTAQVLATAPQAPVLRGEHRVALHTIEGQVKRGVAADIDLGADGVVLAAGSGGAPERIPYARAKALFFLLQPGEKPPVSSGKRVQVTFADGRKVEGHLEDDVGPGFFLVPADARTNTARMYVLHHAVRSVTP